VARLGVLRWGQLSGTRSQLVPLVGSQPVLRGNGIPLTDEGPLCGGGLTVRADGSLKIGVCLVVLSAPVGDFILCPLAEILIRRGRRLPRARQRLEHGGGQRGTPGKAGKLAEQLLMRCGGALEHLRVLVQRGSALVHVADRRLDGTAICDALPEEPGEAGRCLPLRDMR